MERKTIVFFIFLLILSTSATIYIANKCKKDKKNSELAIIEGEYEIPIENNDSESDVKDSEMNL